MTYNFYTKRLDGVIITISNILREINYRISIQLSFPYMLQYIIYQIPQPVIRTSLIVLRKIHFTVAFCIYIVVLYIKQLLTNMFLFHFQIKDTDVHVYAGSWNFENGDRNQQNNKLSTLFPL